MSGGTKFDQGKNRLDLVPPEFIEGTAEILTFGAEKYDDHNWRGGIKYSRVTGALMRHFMAFMAGEKNDPESGKSHLKHMACNLAFLMTFEAHPEEYAKWDDLYYYDSPKEVFQEGQYTPDSEVDTDEFWEKIERLAKKGDEDFDSMFEPESGITCYNALACDCKKTDIPDRIVDYYFKDNPDQYDLCICGWLLDDGPCPEHSDVIGDAIDRAIDDSPQKNGDVCSCNRTTGCCKDEG